MTENNGELSAESQIRVVGRRLAIASATGKAALEEVGLDIARLTSGQDPDAIDESSPVFLAGAAAGLNSVRNGLFEQLVPSECSDRVSVSKHETGGGSQS